MEFRWRVRSCALGFALIGFALMFACTGDIGAPSIGNGFDPIEIPPPELEVVDPDDTLADQRVRRLTEREYHATLEAVFGSELGFVSFPTASAPNGYDNSAAGLRVEGVLAQSLWNSARDLADAGAARLVAEADCPLEDIACADAILEDLASRAYRRPLDDTDRTTLRELFALGAEGSFTQGIALAIRFILQSPDLLYRRELGEPVDDVTTQLTDHEVASLVAYLLTGRPPDATLRALANDGVLSDGEVRAREARRLLDGERVREVVARFAQQWLEVEHLELLARDPNAYPEWPALRDRFEAEAGAFVTDAVLDESAGLAELFLRETTRGDDVLASFYGATQEGGQLRFPPEERRGVLMLAGVLSHLAQAVQPSPVQRGHFVRTRLLCQTLPDPPDELVVAPPDPDPTRTNREVWELTTNGPSCAGCHARMNPIGFAFESFDAVGAFRREDNGKPVDTRGSLGGTDVDGAFDDARGLSALLAESMIARRCFAAHWSEFALGTAPSVARQRTVERAAETYLNGGSIVQLIEDFVGSDAFIRRRVGDTSEGEEL